MYRITCILDGKYYIGVHSTNDLEDGYMGSGTWLKRAIKKHGEAHFKKEILEFFPSSEEMFLKERDVVNEEFILRDDVYNFKCGGSGGDTLQKRKWANDGIKEKYFHINEIPEGWVLGRLNSCKFKDAQFQKDMNSRTDREKAGKSIKKAWEEGRVKRDHSKCGTKGDNNVSKRPEVREKIKQKALSRPMIECPNCGKVGRKSPGMYKFHFDNCKQK